VVFVLVGALIVAMQSGRMTDTDPNPPIAGDSPEAVERPEVEALLSLSAEVMATEAFSYRDDHDDVAVQYAPSRRVLQRSSPRTDNWRYQLLLDGEGFVSSVGERWMNLPDGSHLTLLFVIDPRVQLEISTAAQFEPDESVGGRPTFVVAAEVDTDAFVEHVSPPEDLEGSVRELLDGASVRFWIDPHNHRVLRMEWTAPASE